MGVVMEPPAEGVRVAVTGQMVVVSLTMTVVMTSRVVPGAGGAEEEPTAWAEVVAEVLLAIVTSVELGMAASEVVLGTRATEVELGTAAALLEGAVDCVWVRVTGQTVVYWVRVEVTTVTDSAGQDDTVGAHEVMVISVVEMTVEVVRVVMTVGGAVVEGVASAELETLTADEAVEMETLAVVVTWP